MSMGEPASTLQHQIDEAAEPVAQFWPMTGFVHHNPIHGLEHLPFDEAIREAKHLFGAEGYLPNEVYRGFYRDGRIRERSVERALRRVGPGRDDAATDQTPGSTSIPRPGPFGRYTRPPSKVNGSGMITSR